MRSWPVQPNLTFKDTLHTEAHLVSVESDLHFHCCASNNGMLTSALSIVVCQTMESADVITFHCCVSNNGMLTSSLSIVVCQTMDMMMSALSIVCLHTETHFVPDSVWRVI